MADRWLTFDCYGTLVDWRHGITVTGELLFPGHGEAFLEAYNAFETEVEDEAPFRRYREVLAEATRRAANRLGLKLDPDNAYALASTIPYWPVFPDTGPALTTLISDGWKLAILTNCDRDLIAETQRRLPVPFDAVFTAEAVGAYKPNPAHFRTFQARFGASAGDWIHVAQSYYHDIEPTHALGIKRIWVNRLSEQRNESLADAVITTLADLPTAVLTI
jgi:2-haloacid dehalogenase